MSLSRVAIAGTAAMILLSAVAPVVRAQPAAPAPTAAPAPAGAPAPIAAPPPAGTPPPPPVGPILPTPTPTPTIPPPSTTAATAVAPAPPPTVKAASGAPVSGAIISGYGVTGQLVDPSDRIRALLESIAPTGSPFIESGAADRIGTPIGTIPRLTQSLDSIGYGAKVRTVGVLGAPAPGQVQIAAEVHPYDRLRYIFVDRQLADSPG